MSLRENTERKEYEERGEKRYGTVRTDEERKWDEGPRGVVEGNGDPHHRGFSWSVSDRPYTYCGYLCILNVLPG